MPITIAGIFILSASKCSVWNRTENFDELFRPTKVILENLFISHTTIQPQVVFTEYFGEHNREWISA